LQQKSRAIATGVCAIAAAASLSACGKKQAAPPPQGPATVGVVTVQSQAVAVQTELPGRTTAYQTSEVRPQVGGLVTARLFQEGANVSAGQPLYRIDPATYQAAVRQAQAQLASAQATLTAARLRANRYTELVKINAVSKQEADDAVASAGQASASVQQTSAALQQARINLGYTTVRAPISGRIGRSTFTQGALVTASQTDPLTVIQRLDPIYVDISRSSTELLTLRQQFASGQLSGAQASVRVDQSTGAVTLRAIFPNPGRVLLPGMYVRALVTNGVATNGILAPQPGVTRDPKGQASAMVVNAQGKVEQRMLTVGQTVGSNWLVTSGLRAGDRVIVEGLQKVKPGDAVKAVPAGSSSAAPPNGAAAGQGAGR
jgi:membrane fusion protein (multidrug efflux system)